MNEAAVKKKLISCFSFTYLRPAAERRMAQCLFKRPGLLDDRRKQWEALSVFGQTVAGSERHTLRLGPQDAAHQVRMRAAAVVAAALG